MKTKLLFAGCFYLLCSLPALAQITWQGTNSRDWATTTNWSPNQVPTATDNVVIPSVANTPIIGAGTSASANAVTVQGGASLSIASMGSLTVYGSMSDGAYTTAFRNLGTVNNSGQLILGSTTAASFGLVNGNTFVNNQSGQISIDQTSQIALWNPTSATFTNQGNITTGAAVGTSNASIYNEATFQNSGGIITIDRANGSAIYDRPGSSFVNSGTLAIGQNAGNGGPGIYNFGNFQNLVGGAINIDQTNTGIMNLAGTYNGVTNNASISFTNAGKIALGQKTGISGPGIFNYSNSAYPITFENQPGNTILVDGSYTAISNNFNVSFINSGTIAVGQQSANVNGPGIYNNSNATYPQSFTNNAGAAIVIDRASGGGISNQANISFVNAGTITVGQSATNTTYSPGIYNTSYSNANTPVTFENRSGGVISLDRVSAGIHNDTYCTFTNTGLLKIGTVGAIGFNPGIYNKNVFTNQEGAEIQLDKLGQTGIQIDGGTFTNGGKITIGISTMLGSYYPAINNGGFSSSAQFNNLSTGKIYIDRCPWVGFYNYATLTNAGLIAIGNEVLGGQQGVYNNGTLTNQLSGTITVDHIDAQNYSTNGIYNDYNKTFTNDGRLIIGQTTSAGLNGLYNYGTFSNTNSISIDNVTSTTANTLYTHGLYNASSFTNTGQLTIGSNGSVGRWGLYNTSTFNNNSGGAITIDRSTFAGLRNDGTYTNVGQVSIGSNASVGEYGLYNASTFNNNTGSKLTVDNAVSTGIRNGDLYFTSSTFTNAGVVTIGSKSTVGDYGLFNSTKFINSNSLTIGALASTTAVGFTNPTSATFTNNACAVVTLLDKLENGGLLTNEGLFTANTTKPHDNTALTNNGIIVYPQGNSIPNVTNNDLIAGPISTTCGTATPALQIGGSNSFSVGSSWYKEATLTTVAGTYSPNTFVATDLPGGTVPLYFAITDPTNGCTRTVSIPVTVDAPPALTVTTSGTLACAQTSVTITANATGGTSYTLNNSTTNTTGQFVVTNPGTYTLTVANASGCTSTTAVTVFSNTTPPTNVSLSSGTLTCGQPSLTLTASATGATSYSFSAGTPLGGNQVVVNAPGGYTVTAIGANGCTATASVTVSQDNTAPSASILPTSATLTCASPTVSLTAAGGDSYRWDDGSVSAVHSVSTAGTYSVTVTASNGCTGVTSATVTGTPAITATIAGATTVCAGQTTSLTATGGDTYVWSIGQNSPIVSVTAGVYALTATSGSCSATASFTLASLLLPQPPTLLTSSDANRPNLSVPGGLTSATVTVGDPGLAILTGNCAGTVSWSASNGTSGTGNFVVPTTTPATLSFTATCNNSTCTSSPSDPLVVTILGGTTALRLIQPTYDCQTGAITFQTTGGNGATVEFRGIGITDWTTNPNQTVDLAIRQDPNSQPLLLQARQSGMVTTYTFDFRLYCSGTGPNQPPVFTQPPTQTAIVGQAFSYRIPDETFRGINGTAVNFAVTGLPNGLQYSSLTRIISGTATAVGTYSVTLSVNDPQSLSATGTMTIVVNPALVVQPPVSGTTNVAPVFNGPLATQYGTVGATFTYTLPNGVFTDANLGDVLTLSALGLPAGLGFDPTTGVISGTPTTVATTSVTLTATDPGSLSISGLLSIVISASATLPPTGPQPFVVLQPLYNCQTGAITFQTSGGDGSPVYFSCIGVVASSTVASYTLDAAIRNDANSQPLLIKATQGGVVGSFIFDFRLYCTIGVPTPPIFVGPIGPVSGTVGVGLSYQIPGNVFNSSGGAALNYTVTGLPAGLGFAPATAIVSGTATTAGSFTATVTATDPFNQSAQGPLAFTIAPAPVVQPPVSGSALTLLAPVYNCQTGAFTFRSSGGDGVNSIEYFAVGITGWSTQAGPYTVLPASDAQPFTLKARQNGVEVSYTWDFKATCLGASRLGVERNAPWTASVVGNPVTNELVVTLNGAEGQRLDLLLSDVSGHLIEQRRIVPTVSSQRTVFDVHHQSAGLLFLQVAGGGRSQTIKVLKE